MPPKKPRTKPSGSLKRFAEAKKYETRILGDVQRHLLAQVQNEGRDLTVLHASELCYKGFCERAAFYRLTGVEGLKDEAPSFQIEAIWEEGHEIQRKWNGWLHAMGRLRGTWRCVHGHHWEAVSPLECPVCEAPEPLYCEVVLWSDEYQLSGHADGDIDEGTDDDPLLEVKSIGVGTLRKEAPSLLAKYTHRITLENGEERSVTDLDRLWREIKRPFASHLKQGMLYCFLAGRSTIIFIYEFKPTQAVKEFVVKFQPALIKDLLETALDIQWAVKKGKVPNRPAWAESIEQETCKKCVYRGTCWDVVVASTQGEPDADETEEGHGRTPGRGVAPCQSRPGAAGPKPRPQAKVQRARGSDPDHGDGRQGADEPVRSPHSLAGFLDRATGSGGSRRAVRRRPPEDPRS